MSDDNKYDGYECQYEGDVVFIQVLVEFLN